MQDQQDQGNAAGGSEVPLLEVKNLKMYYPLSAGFAGGKSGEVKAVDDVSFTINAGETLGLVGESGCGKSTTGRCILRAIRPTAGQINYRRQDGTVVDLAQLSDKALKPYRREVRMVFQDPYSSLNPRMTVLDIVGEPLRVNKVASGRELEDRVAELLRKSGLRPDYMRRYPHAFSGGERQRISIARALALDPRLVVLDEAVSALDVSVRAQILNLLEDLQEELKLTYLFISHDLSVIEHICDRVAVMYVGKLVESAPTDTLFRQPEHPYSEALISSVPISDPALRANRARLRLSGEIADPSNPPSGCAFHPRCRFATDICSQERPPLRTLPGHDGRQVVACHHAEELALHGVRSNALAAD